MDLSVSHTSTPPVAPVNKNSCISSEDDILTLTPGSSLLRLYCVSNPRTWQNNRLLRQQQRLIEDGLDPTRSTRTSCDV